MTDLRTAAQQFVTDYENGDLGDLKHYARALRTALAQQEPSDPGSVPVKRSRMEALSKALGHPTQLAVADGDTAEDALVELAASRLEQPEQEHTGEFNDGTLEGVLRERAYWLRQPEQEPVAHLWQHSETGRTRVVMPDQVVTSDAAWLAVGPLYLHPPRREWRGLSEEEIAKCWHDTPWNADMKTRVFASARAIEAKLKELNT
jgi:hypothetical protein